MTGTTRASPTPHKQHKPHHPPPGCASRVLLAVTMPATAPPWEAPTTLPPGSAAASVASQHQVLQPTSADGQPWALHHGRGGLPSLSAMTMAGA